MRPRVFLGYAIFWGDQPFYCSRQTVTKDTLYLKAHCLAKQNMIPMHWLDIPTNSIRFKFQSHQTEIDLAWQNRDKRIQLRRVYAV